MASSIKIDDKQSRNTIVKDTKRNYFVEASAGSGKTTSLVYRMVSLIEHGGDDGKGVTVDKICTITFTKAAANEFFERFQKLLSIRCGDQPDKSDDYLGKRDDDTKERCQRALNNIDLCFMGTIDAFCNMIAHEMPAELDIPSSSTIISDEDYSRLVKEQYDGILKDNKHPLHDLALKYNGLTRNSFEAFSEGLAEIMDFRNLKIIFDESLADLDFDTVFSTKDKTDLLSYMKDISNSDKNLLFDLNTDTGKTRASNQRKVIVDYKVLDSNKNNWSDKVTLLSDALKSIIKMKQFQDSADQTDIAPYIAKPSAQSNYCFTPAFLNDIKHYQNLINDFTYSVYFKLLVGFMDEVAKTLKEQGKFRFFDFLLYLREAFKKSALGDRVLIEHIYERHKYFLLDESQDTSPLQTELFFYLTSEKADPDWKKSKLHEGSLFIVGDPKQSIYSFKGADVQAYLINKEIFEKKKELLVLTKNFRSNVNLKEWFNSTFNDLLNYQTDPNKIPLALEHIDIPIDIDEATQGIPQNDPVILDGPYRYIVKATGTDATDCEDVAKLVLDIKNNRKIYRVKYNPATNSYEKYVDEIHFGDFLVSPRSSAMQGLVEAFNALHIPIIVEGKRDFNAAKIYEACTKILYLLKDPTNKAAFKNATSLDLFLLIDLDYVQMLNDGFDLDISNPDLDKINFSMVEHKQIIDKLHKLYKKTSKMSFSSTLLTILNDKEFNIFEYTSSDNLEYIYYLIEKIKEGEENGSISSLSQLKNYVESFESGDDEQRIMRFKDKVDRVKISNIHKVKGLQAPIVILPKPYYNIKDANKNIDYTVDPPCAKYAFIKPGDPEKRFHYVDTSAFDSELSRWNAISHTEEDRLLYVAATRAEAALVVTEREQAKSAKEFKPGYWGGLLATIPSTKNLPIPNDPSVTISTKDVQLEDYNIKEDCHNPSFTYISPSQMRHHSFSNNDDVIDDALFDETKGDDKASIKGTMIHKLMECIVSSKNTYNIDALIEKILSDYGNEQEYKDMLHNVANTIQSGGFKQTNSQLDKDILKTLKNAKKVWCETPFSYLSKNGNIVNGIIDLIYEDQDGYCHVIDYKTNKESDVSILEDKNHYASQLQHYIDALVKNKMPVVDAHIYHIDLR